MKQDSTKWVKEGLGEFMRTVGDAPNRMAFCVLFEQSDDGHSIASAIHTEARGTDKFLGTCIGQLSPMLLNYMDKGMKGDEWTDGTKMMAMLVGMQEILKRDMGKADNDTPSSLSVGEDGKLQEGNHDQP
jgi:hypothetical protein